MNISPFGVCPRTPNKGKYLNDTGKAAVQLYTGGPNIAPPIWYLDLW